MLQSIYTAFRAAFVVAPRYLKLTRSGDHRGALRFLNAIKTTGPLSLPRTVAIVHEHGMLEEYARVIEICEEAGLDLGRLENTPEHSDRYLVAYAMWWRLVSQDKLGLGEARVDQLGPYLEQVDLSKVIAAYKKAFPLTPHPDWKT